MTAEEILDKYAVGVAAGQYTIECDKAHKAMLEYAEAYHLEKIMEAYRDTPIQFVKAKHFEYKQMSCSVSESIELVSKFGNDGWEMCGSTYDREMTRDHFWFKRRKLNGI